ncbi:MAG: hypothetical protein QF489_00500 [Planctomycetota bacterium]|nr:hypothetical protein [Planctomycetota bacterium]
MEHLATLITDMPLDERYFHGLLRDIAATSTVAAIKPAGKLAEHFLSRDGHGSERASEPAGGARQRADCLVELVSVLELPVKVVRQLHEQGFRAECLLEFWLNETQAAVIDQEDPWLSPAWPLLDRYAQELRGWVLTSALGFEETVARCGDEKGLMRTSLDGDDPAVLISANTMNKLIP